MPVPQTFTARAALAVSRAAYRALLDRAFESADGHARGVAQRAFERGYQSLIALEATASDVALSEDASEALTAYIGAIRTADQDAALMWLDLFPEMIGDVRRGADLPVEIHGTPEATTAVRTHVKRHPEPEYQPAANKQPALALAA
jgi:hypothetical protein